ncbi:MAG: ribonuclease HII [Sulfurimonadaceae bacterium]|jgi:ribonuclease HII|nr:ribonuclease HII [Sulfurimonadaceae bacterium]
MSLIFCGIDEAGRGPLAGDLVMAGCILHASIDGLNDSKKLTAKKREKLFVEIQEKSTYHIVRFSASDIDTLGISTCLKNGLIEITQNLQADSYLFDGNNNHGLSHIETMVQADGKIAEVSAASILAKVTHDFEILELAKLYPQYELEKHKGYGTKRHVELIKQYGLSDIHRKTYKIKALEPTLF